MESVRPRTSEPLSKRRIEQAGFQIHATAFKVTVALAMMAWLVVSAIAGGFVFPFPLIPAGVWAPFVGLHAASAYRSGRDASDDDPLRLPWTAD